MLLPIEINPKSSIYYNESIILEKLKNKKEIKMMDLNFLIRKNNDMSISIFLLSLDWLYLIDVIKISDEGIIKWI